MHWLDKCDLKSQCIKVQSRQGNFIGIADFQHKAVQGALHD